MSPVCMNVLLYALFMCIYVYTYIYVLVYYILVLRIKYFVPVQSTRILWVTSCTGFVVVIGFLTFPFNTSLKVQYFPRYHNVRGEIVKIYDVIITQCKYVCEFHEYYINVVDYLLTIDTCGLFSIDNLRLCTIVSVNF